MPWCSLERSGFGAVAGRTARLLSLAAVALLLYLRNGIGRGISYQTSAHPIPSALGSLPQRPARMAHKNARQTVDGATLHVDALQQRRENTRRPPPPPSTLARAVAARVAASIAAEAAEDLKYEFNYTCNPIPHAGFSGDPTFTWGLVFKTESEQDCCGACQAHRRMCGPGGAGKVYVTRQFRGNAVAARCGTNEHTCNTWVFCPVREETGGRCWSNDKWNHTFGEWHVILRLDPTPS